MTEYQIKQKAKEICKQNKWLYYAPPKTRFQHSDIFNIADCLIWREEGIILVQLTTLSNLSARRRKIKKIMENISFSCPTQIWAYDKTRKVFKIENI